MRIAYLDCASGISGDMTLAALVDAGVDLGQIQKGIDSLGLPSCQLVATTVKKKGFRATQIVVEHEPEHAHRHLHHIMAMIEQSALTQSQRELAGKIFHRLATAEAKVHGSTIEKVHFHEVGAVDSIADIVGAAIGWDLLGVDKICASPVPTGTGFVEIAHGRCSIPAPATGELLTGIPLANFPVEGELTTPTGAAILATLASEFGPLPAMAIEQIGYGAGQKDFDHPNLLRLLVGADSNAPATDNQIVLLEANIDDMTGEQLAYATQQLLDAGALDVTTTSISMKKGRPGVLLAVQSTFADASRLQAILFEQTTTLGLRRMAVDRIVLPREPVEVMTPWGPISGKVVMLPGGTRRFSPEYEACRVVAERESIPLREVETAAQGCFDNQQME